MRSLGTLWNTLAARDSTVLETVAVINNTEYSAITPPIINHSLMASDTLTVGNCIASSLIFTVMTTNAIPKSAKVVIKCRLVDGSSATSWFEFGTFWVSKRTVDDDLVTLECYDAMLKGNQAYGGSEDAMNWPKPMQTVLNTIASRLGVSIDSRTSIRSDSTTYKCEYPGDMTLLEVLGHIGACNGGNWIITHENKLRLVPLAGSGSTVNIPAVLSQITTGNAYTITGISMVMDEEHEYAAGNDSGYVLTINPAPYACQTIADNLYNALNGLTYHPFTLNGSIYNPAVELGDTLVAGDVTAVLFSETRTYDVSFRADAAAPSKDELEDEYPYPSEIVRLQNSTVELKRNDEVMSSSITQLQTEITTKVTAGEVESIIEQKADSIRLRAKKISWSSTYSSMTEDGHLECTGATIRGSVYAESRTLVGTQWIEIENGMIHGGDSTGSEDGRILFGGYVANASDGIYIQGNSMFLDTYNMYTNAWDSDKSQWVLYKCFSGTRRFITDIQDNGDGTITWSWKDYRIENGLMLN